MTTLPKEFYRTIQDVARKAKHTSSVKQVFQDLIQVMFNTIHATQRSFPYKFHFDPRMVRELKEYKTQPELWKKLAELSKMWLKAIQAAEPFEDVMGSAYDEPDAPAVFTAVFSPEKVQEAIERQKTYQALRQQAQAFDQLTRKLPSSPPRLQETGK